MPSVSRGIANENDKGGNQRRCPEEAKERKSNNNKAKNAYVSRAKSKTGTCEPPPGPASPVKTPTEGALM